MNLAGMFWEEENYIKYHIDIGYNVSINPIEVELNAKYIRKLVLNTEDERKLLIVVYLKNVVDEKTILNKIKQDLNKIIDKISYNFNLCMGEPCFLESNINQKKAGARYVSCTMDIPLNPKIEEIEKLKKDLNKNINKDHLLSLYRGIMQCTDNVAKYMLLYSILAELKGPYQNNVDNFIRLQDPTVEEKNSTKDPSKKETIYTYYRNQIGHTNENSDITKNRSFIDMNIENFMNIVKKAIEENIN